MKRNRPLQEGAETISDIAVFLIEKHCSNNNRTNITYTKMPFPLVLKSKPDYVDLDADFKPLPKHGHLTQHHAEYAAVQPVIDVMYDQIWALPDFDAFRLVGRGADAAVPPGGPDRARDVVTEFLRFPARDGHVVELKLYKSPKVQSGAALMLRMHGGGELLHT